MEYNTLVIISSLASGFLFYSIFIILAYRKKVSYLTETNAARTKVIADYDKEQEKLYVELNDIRTNYDELNAKHTALLKHNEDTKISSSNKVSIDLEFMRAFSVERLMDDSQLVTLVMYYDEIGNVRESFYALSNYDHDKLVTELDNLKLKRSS